MNKEEQIKRLAQNLFKNGFTKSMDYAIQTAANMLGFPDSMVVNDLMKKEDSRYAGTSLLNGGADLSQSAQSSSAKKEEFDADSYRGADFARRLSQSMAEERVFSQIPSHYRPPSPSQQENKEVSMDANVAAEPEPTQSPETVSSDRSADAEERVFIDYSDDTMPAQAEGENIPFSQGTDEQRDTETYQRGDDRMTQEAQFSGNNPGAYDAQEDSSLEDSSFFSELREEEQTSLISGYMSSGKEDFFTGEKQTQATADKNIFKGEDHENEGSRGSNMYERVDDVSIRSRFPVEFDTDEDFFTPAMRHSEPAQEQSREPVQEQYQQQQAQQSGMVSAAQSQGAQQEKPAEANVDITTMFDFRNMRG